MPGILRILMVAAAACLAAFLLWPMPQTHIPGMVPHPAGVAAIPAPSSGARIWYTAKNMPLLSLPGGRQEIVRSVLNITRKMQFGDYAWNEDRIPQGPVWVRVDLTRQLLSVFRGGHEIGSAVILYGTDGKPTPTGSFSILEKDAHHISHTYDAPMPFMLRLTNDGVAIHGSAVREGYATHGCIGVPLDFARLLFGVTKKGDNVVIVPLTPTAGKA
jgi:L,D-transpeptidase catalytic domain